jgi:hypothetical protein
MSARRFATLDVKKPELISNDYYAVKVLQQLLSFHLNDRDPQALIDVDLHRLDFVYNKSILSEKDSLYLSALTSVEQQFKSSPFSTNVNFEIAKLLVGQGANYKPLVSDDNRWKIKKAVGFCEKAIKAFPESTGVKNCQNLLASIKKPSIDITIEGQVLPNETSLALLKRKNVNRAYFRVVAMDYVKFVEDNLQKNAKEMAQFLAKEKPLLEWDINLPDEGDFQQHAAEIEIPVLEKGFYLLLASNNEKFSVKDIVTMGRHPYLGRFSSLSKTDKDHINFALKSTSTYDFRHKSINELSGGEKQRAFIARALAQDTDIVLLDEPVSMLDINHQIEIMDTVKHLSKNLSTQYLQG